MLTLVSFLISCLSFCYLLEDYFLAIAWCIVIWSGTIILYTLRRTRLEKERVAPLHHNIHLFVRSAGQVITLAIFTFLDGYLKSKERVFSITLCASFFLHLVFGMVIFRIREDMEVAMGFLTAGFILFFESCADAWEALLLVSVSYILACTKSFLIDRKGIEYIVEGKGKKRGNHGTATREVKRKI